MFKLEALPQLIALAANFALCLFVLGYKRGRKIFVLYGALSFGISIWTLSAFFLFYDLTPAQALIWARALHLGVLFVPPLFFHFVCLLLNPERASKFVIPVYGLAAFFLALNAAGKLILDVPKTFFGFWPTGNFVYFFFTIYVTAVLAASAYLVKRAMQRSFPRRLNQLRYIFLGACLALLGVIHDFLPIAGVSSYAVLKTPVYPFGSLAAGGYGVCVGYAILRRQLMDIGAMIKKALVFAGLLGMVTAVIAGVRALMLEVIGRFLAVPAFVSTGLSAAAAVLLYEPFRKLLVHVTDRCLFQKKESIKIILNRLSAAIITVLDIDKAGEMILGTLRDSMRLESGAIMLLEENGGAYRLFNSFGLEEKNLFIDTADPLIQLLDQTHRTINLDDPEDKPLLAEAALNVLNGLKAIVAIPLFLHDDLIGILALGKKKSDEEFTEEELDCLPVISSQAAIALSNARLFDILKKSQIDFAQQAKMAAIGTLSAGISHEIKNPLQVIKGVVEMLKLNKKFGVYDSMNKEQYIAVVEDVSERILAAVARAVGVIDRLSGFAKKPKELKIEPVHLEKAVESALEFLKSEFEYFSITVKKTFDPSCPEVLADLQALEEVILNLLVNARHAVMEKGTVKVSTANRGNEVEIAIEDSGQGIRPENIEKIFDPFFTTKDTTRNADPASIKGTGLGLFIVRETVKRFGGRIAVESAVGKGTTFRIILPVPRAEALHPAAAKKEYA